VALDQRGIVCKVRVVTGDELAKLDTTGTLTGKYQARVIPRDAVTELVSPSDTKRVTPLLAKPPYAPFRVSPTDPPEASRILPIQEVYARLLPLVGQVFVDPGSDQERNRGEALHRLVCHHLGYGIFGDTGTFPDVRHQLLEVKLQTAATIDLGVALPSDSVPLDIPPLDGTVLRHCDARYCIVYADRMRGNVVLTHLFLVTGADFFNRFPQLEGKTLNQKLQLHLPPNLLC
jgi:hypothetical protein